MATTRRYVVKNGLDNNSNSIINVSDPTNDSDAATKNFAKNADNLSSGTVAAARMPALSGDVTTTVGTTSTTIASGAVTLAKMANLAASSIIGNNTGSPATPLALSASQVKTLLSLTSSDVGLGNVTNVAQIPMSYLDTDTALAANSDTKVATQKAVKAYADGLIGANDAMQYKGVIDCSTNPNYPAANAGHTYKVSVAGLIGGASGDAVEIGDTLICTTDGSAAGTKAAVGANWNIIQANIDGAVTGPTSAVSNNFASFNGTGGKIIKDSGYTSTSFVAANSSITGATNTKITYDSKGLVTSGTSATTADIADSTDKRYCTDAQKTVIGNTSNINSGDETTSTIKTKLGITTLSGSNTGDQTISITGDVTATGSTGTLSATVTKINGTLLSGLATGLLKNTTSTGVPVIATAGTDYVSPSDNVLPLTNGKLASATLTTSTTTADQVVDTAAIATYRTVKYLIQVSCITPVTAYQTTEVLLIHDGSTVYITEYATVLTGVSLATFNADINSNNLRLLTTPTYAATTYKVVRTGILV